MNERIKDIIEQCTVPERRTPLFYRFSHKVVNPNEPYLDAEKFAKLIIEECVEQLSSPIEEVKAQAEDKKRTDIQRIISGAIAGCTVNSVNRIKEHFGVE